VIRVTDSAVLLRSARKNSGLTQEALASRVGVDQARVSRSEGGQESPRFDTVDKLLAATGHRLYAAPTRRDDAASIASSIRESVEAKDPKRALRQLIQLNDNLVAETGLVRGVLGLAEPESTGKKLWDAAIAAVVAWRLNEQNLPLPEWVSDPKRKLERSRPLSVDPADPIPGRSDIPDEFAERGVLAWRDTFASV
jgi:transcriptional regulator with XRE-family HTH domain